MHTARNGDFWISYSTPRMTCFFWRKITYLAGFGQVGQNIGRFSINLGGSCQEDLGISGFWDSIQMK